MRCMHLSLPADPHTRVCTCTLPMIYSGAGTLFLLGIRDILCLPRRYTWMQGMRCSGMRQ